MVTPGYLIDQKYEILTEIGRGGMSTVYLAIDRRLNKQWAIKEIKRTNDLRANNIIINSLWSEANLMKKLDHPALPRIVDIIEENNTIYVVMDYVEGRSLDTILEEGKRIPQNYVVEWAKQLCDALSYLHNCKPAIIYRDMKPANIMIKPDGNVKLIDFGIAREYKQDHQKDTTCLGTRGYAAPEQFGGKGQTDPRTDIYCLGVTLYHMVTGHDPSEPPYQIYPIRMWDESLSTGLEKILLKCTEMNPDDRYSSCKELMYDLEHYTEMDDEVIQKKRKKKKRFFAAVSACITFTLTGMFFQDLANHNSNNYYANLVQEASTQTDQMKKTQKYQEAIAFAPERADAYLGWIESMKSDDGKFTLEEEKNLIEVLNQYKDALREESQEYVCVNYEIGRLYWFYYEYGETSDNKFVRARDAVPWFAEAVKVSEEKRIPFENYDISLIYRDIGIFIRDYSTYVHEARINDKAGEYWSSLVKFETFLCEHSDEDELILWEGYDLITNSIDLYLGKFLNSGIEYEEINEFCEKMMMDVSNLEATDELTKSIQQDIDQKMEQELPAKFELVKNH